MQRRRKALILIEGSRSNGLLYVQAAKQLGLHPITLAVDPTQYDYLVAESSEAIKVDTESFNALMDECLRLRSRFDIAGITGFTGRGESVYATVAKLCRHFGLPGPNPASIEQCCDKFTQRQLLAHAGAPVPAYRLAANSAEVEIAAAEIGLPVIVKPAVGNGSSGVRLCRDAKELAEHTTYLLGGGYPWVASPKILVEEFAEGPFFEVVTMGNAVVAVGEADFGPPPHFVPWQSTFPAQLTEEEHERITNVSLMCLRHLGLGWGPANIEFRWTERGPVIMEVNARLPGWTTPRLTQLAYGLDIIREHIKILIGDECDLRTKPSRTAIARFVVPDCDGTLTQINGVTRAVAVPGVVEVRFYIKPGLPCIRKGDYLDIIGHVIAASPDRTRAEAIIQRAVNLVDWSIAPF
ncbi:ATP-grasp domain-containing protein [Sinorhizobium meliloti]|uniref:ATP-grasp domain-containing protein n=1 Tax=Rhizobium meliloti TaxID=382 RepID=UPI000FD2EEB0|nr:acetyl-CoA carboxylase biotin carboxylase subunit family protein [Sinorhizobium meliloti]RVI09182.1 ATP-grasp domain-containing protein [Sinorhizobium meliloti]RVN79369.1 ATP-grasp domain-containing protein [Sinorhizobium meliloti]RVN99495.1 ATP-grasp domain-containing protein [Sinorhizobium meliloti]